ncbi:hypothetical protein KKG08_00200 [Patescibacteria group bacterium]|nr:hypothetical protein [Patescibacteria group bacterium]
MDVEDLRNKLSELRKKRTYITVQKGFAANHNKDLRENATYDNWLDQEFLINAEISEVIEKIEKLTNTKPKHKWEKPKPTKKGGVEKQKWL